MKLRHTIIAVFAAAGLALVLSCGGRGNAGTTAAQTAGNEQTGNPVALYTCRVVNTYPHSTGSYTQGLQWYGGSLYEGTGLYGRSALMRVELETGRALQRVELPGKYFGEGIALLGGRIYQLTWQENEGFIYDAATLERKGTFRYPGEGWGLTTDGKMLYMSDGTEWLYNVEPTTMRRMDSVAVRYAGRPLKLLNELEWIGGEIWANVYTTDQIVRINPASGEVTGIIDLSGLLPTGDHRDDTDVLNGIACDGATGRVFVTGKNWPKLFEIEVRRSEK